MLEWVDIVNFQRHELRRLKLDKYCTVICGPTDIGKSSILRAIRWASLNQPAGNAFIRKGADFTQVTLGLDGREVVRKRSGTENSYTLDGKLLPTLEREKVPDAVAALLNLSEGNFSGQFDTPMWFGLSAGSVSKELNAIVNLSQIDDTLANLATEVRKAKAEVTVSEGRLSLAKQQRDELVWVQAADEKLGRLEKLDSSIANHEKEGSLLGELLGSLQALGERSGSLQGAITRLETVLTLASELATIEAEQSGLSRILQTINRTEQRCQKLTAEEAEVAGQMTLLVKSEGCPLCGRPMTLSSLLSAIST